MRLLPIVLLALTTALFASAEESLTAAPAAKTPPRLVLEVVGTPPSAAWADSIRKHLADHLWIAPISTRDGAVPVVTVVFGTPGASTNLIGCELAGNAATVWADSLKGPAPESDLDATTLWQWRIEKQTTFAAARILGKAACVFPVCVMQEASSLADLDLKARNLCPPCRDQWRQQLGLVQD